MMDLESGSLSEASSDTPGPALRPLRSGRNALRPRSRSRTRGRHEHRSASRVGSRESSPIRALAIHALVLQPRPVQLFHRCRSRDPDETEEIRENLLRRRREPEPRLRERRVVGDDAALRVEAVEGRREVLRRVGQPVRRALLRGRGDQARGVGERSQQIQLGLGCEQRQIGLLDRVGARSPPAVALRRIDAIRACPYWT